MRRLLIIGILIFTATYGKASQKDESVCRQIVVEFYKWYSQKLTSDNPSEFQPKFAQDKNGYTTLDFTAYVKI
jgi:hypothetical protein